MINPTQVINVDSCTISGLQISDDHEFKFERPIEPIPSDLRKVDNGMVYMYNGQVTDISFAAIPDSMLPAVTQSTFQWYIDRYSKGIANSVNGSDGAAYLKAIKDGKYTFEPAYKYFRAGTHPWFLFSDLDYDIFRKYDSVGLYKDMAARAFAYSDYTVTYIDTCGCTQKTTGKFLMIPVLPAYLSPTFINKGDSYKISIACYKNQTIELFWPAFWIGERPEDGLFNLTFKAKYKDFLSGKTEIDKAVYR